MIFYFSGTGNSKFIAQRIANGMGCEAHAVSTHTPFEVPDNDEAIGFVFPVYFWGVPTAAVQFLSTLKISGSHYRFLVLDCGGSTGDASGMVEQALGQKLNAVFSLLMPDTYVPLYNVTDSVHNQAILDKALPEIDRIMQQVAARENGNFDRHRSLGKFNTATMYPLYRRKTTKPFAVSSTCVGCGLCAEVCPGGFIEMQEGRPSWKAGHCNLCFACLHHCPQGAISYGKRSRKHGQYLCPDVKP